MGPHRSSAHAATSETRAVTVTAVVLGLWAALTLAAPWLAQPVSSAALALLEALGLLSVTAEVVA